MCRSSTTKVSPRFVILNDVLTGIAYHSLSDNVDTKVFPNYESNQTIGPVSYIMPNMYPDVDWMMESYDTWDASTRVLYKESQTLEFHNAWAQKAGLAPNQTRRPKSTMAPAESAIKGVWQNINTLVEVLIRQEDTQERLPDALKALPQELHAIRLAMEKLREASSTTAKPEDLPTMFHENMLISCYTKFEVLRALYKLVEQLREKVVNPKSKHYMKAKLPKNWVNDIASETQICFDAIRDVANSYIKLINEKGVAAIKAQVRWGATGDALKKLLKDDDVDFYAREYVDSALHAWKGVLQVKLK
jgi:N-terminal acetyltransferase B complex non-catalytic subunit